MDNNTVKKKKSFIKKLLIGIGSFFIILILLAILIPYFFKDKIKAFVLEDINNSIEAEVKMGDIDISIFKSFPNISAGINNLEIEGVDSFKNQNLFTSEKINLELDILSVISSSKPVEIVDFSIISPSINIIVLENGNANYNIFKEKNEQESEDSQINDIKLKHYSITNANIIFTDFQNNSKLDIKDLNHHGEGDFKDIIFVLNTNSNIDELSYISENITYLKKAKLKWDINFSVDLNKMMFKIKENTLQLNDLKLVSEGLFKIEDKFADLDFQIKAPGNNFKEIFSIIPNAFTKDFDQVKAKGDFSLNANFKGKYHFDKAKYPDFNIAIKAKNGYIKYPELSIPIEKINGDIRINKRGESLNNTTLKINPLTFSIQGERMLMNMDVKNILVDPLSKGLFKGSIDLGALSKAFPLDDIKELSGKLITDLNFEFNQSLTKQDLNGHIDVDNITTTYSDYPKVRINSAKIDLSNSSISITNLDMKAGKSDIAASITILEPLNYNTKNKTTSILINGKSNTIDLNEWIKNEETSQKENESNLSTLNFLKNRLKVTFDYRISNFQYEDYDIKDLSLNGVYYKNSLTINNQSLVLDDSKININGKLDNILTWSMENEKLKGNLSVSSPHFDMDKFMAEDSKNTTSNNASDTEDFQIPDKMDLTINTNISKINYTKKDLRNLHGQLLIKNQAITFNNFSAEGMGGTMNIDGIFSTPPDKKANFDIRYRMTKMKYEEMFKSVISFKTFAPVTEFINGIFNADFSFKGELNKGFTPDFSSINASGLIHTLDAYIKNYPALNNLASKLQVKSLKNIEIKDSKNSFEIENGTVKVNPFDFEYDEMNFNISGTNKLDKTIDYIIHAKIPKSKIGKIPGGNTIDKGLDFITSKAKGAGFNLDIGKIINIDLSLKGKYNKPKIGIKFVGVSKGNIKNDINENVENVIDDTKEKATKEIIKEKKKIEDKVKKEVDNTKKQANKKIEEEKRKLKEKADKEIEKAKKKAKNKVKDALKDLWK